VVAQPWRRAGKLGILSGLCVAPLQLGGLRGKQSTPSVWLGGTGVVSTVGERERHEQEQRGAHGRHQAGDKARYTPLFCRVEWYLL
jgi:hypothetical protein